MSASRELTAKEKKLENQRVARALVIGLPPNFVLSISEVRIGEDGKEKKTGTRLDLTRSELLAKVDLGEEWVVNTVLSWPGLEDLEGPVSPGKRYQCLRCGTQCLCTKGSHSHPDCCDQPMVPIYPRPLPSSD